MKASTVSNFELSTWSGWICELLPSSQDISDAPQEGAWGPLGHQQSAAAHLQAETLGQAAIRTGTFCIHECAHITGVQCSEY